MDDQAVDMVSDTFDLIVPCCDSVPSTSNSVQTQENEKFDTEAVRKNSDLMVENSLLNGSPLSPPEQGHTLPILKKIIDLSTKIQKLKNEHIVLADQVKLNAKFFSGPEMLNNFRLLSNEHELLKKKYIQESCERKQLYNEVIELKGNIRVFCRCRPLNKREIENGCSSVIEFDSSQDNEIQVICSDSSKKRFKFDHVFKTEDSQEIVFAHTKPIITSVLDGYNVCIFAYGQTGTGKTFTMEGTPESRGVNYRTLEELFRISEDRAGVMKYELYVSMLEVYNEKIRDLLADNSSQPAKKLEIKQAAEGTQEVPGLIETRVYGTKEVWELLKSGSLARSVGSTSANELSSRSHSLLRVTVKGENIINGQRTKSHLWLVDLAGSERVGRIEVDGERLKESQFINKSLSALGDVISALASKTSHIPYRNSKLTHMLQSSLGGDCKTLMFVQISPSGADLGETLCSLNFASRVRGIEGGPARKQTDLTELSRYKQMAEKFKNDEKETKKLQDNLQSMQLRLAAREQACKNLHEKVRDLENQLAEERKTRVKQETRALAASQTSALSSLKPPSQKSMAEKKPPLGPSKLRLPLRRITNFMAPPPPSPMRPRKNTISFPSVSSNGKENAPRIPMGGALASKNLLRPRRSSIAVRSTPSMQAEVIIQPKRRVSIATFRPETSTNMMTTPLHPSYSTMKNSGPMGRPSFVRDSRKARYSRLFSPLEEGRPAIEATPIAIRSSSKFMGSPPPIQGGSGKPRNPTVIALQKKPLVWSPLKLRGLRYSKRPSLMMMPSQQSYI